MTPSYEEILTGATEWRFTHKGVSCLISFHSYRNDEDEYMRHPGIWCYYILIPQLMFPHRWYDFRPILSEYGCDFNSNGFNHDMFDSEITFATLVLNFS